MFYFKLPLKSTTCRIKLQQRNSKAIVKQVRENNNIQKHGQKDTEEMMTGVAELPEATAIAGKRWAHQAAMCTVGKCLPDSTSLNYASLTEILR